MQSGLTGATKMAATQTGLIPRVKLGTQGFQVSKLGFGCMGLSGAYNDPVHEEDGISIIKYAFSKGITFFDTADVYGAGGANEILVGKALKQLPREKIQLATKFGIVRIDISGMLIKGSPDYVRSCCEASLKRLGVDYIDLYYQHRVDTSVPIEETVGELKKLVEEGKVRYIGLSEASPDTIRRAHAVHPITAVQIEWSLWTRDIEDEIVPLCRELGIGIVPYSPLGRGFFGGKGVVENVPAISSLTRHPRFKAENLDKNKKIYDQIESLAKKHGCTPPQLALAWVLQQGEDVVPIPGTTKIKNLDQNLGGLAIKPSEEDLREISEAVPIDDVAGGRYYNGLDHISWKFANTPPKAQSGHICAYRGIIDGSDVVIKGSPDYVRSCCEASLKRLGVDYIDLYYQHRVDTSVPIEETVGELKKLVEEGKVRNIGLSEASPDTIRRAHAVHPITAVQIEWSLWTRDIEDEIVPLCRELGIGIVPYSPLGRGFFGGKGVLENLPAALASQPRFQDENLKKNKKIYDRIESLAKKHECTPPQLALAWVLQQGEDVVPIPGTTKIKNLEQNLGGLAIKLSEEDLREISEAVPIDEIAGVRHYNGDDRFSWQFANTPPKDST